VRKETEIDNSNKNDIDAMPARMSKLNTQNLCTPKMFTLITSAMLTLLALITLGSCGHKKPNILIIGDSISIGYTPFVESYFSEKAHISHNPGNAQHTGTGLDKIEEWISKENWDIIHFNWGLWDLCFRHPSSTIQGNRDKVNGKITFTLEEYASNLDSIVSIMRINSSAKLIYITTSYVPENEHGRFKDDVKKYNDVAKKIMREHSVLVHDIYEESIQIHQAFGKGKDDVHYTNAGYEQLGQLVARFLEKEINAMK
jgi:lysophospholipase L1-like esterase